MRYFPLFLDMQERDVVVVGGQTAASSKVRLLVKTPARIQIIASQINDDVRTLMAHHAIVWHPRSACAEDMPAQGLVVAATGDAAEDRRIAGWARRRGAMVLTVDQPEASDALTPAIVDRAPVVIAIGTEGTAPVLARVLKAAIEALVPAHIGRLSALAGTLRSRVVEHLASGRARRRFWQDFFARVKPLESPLADNASLERMAEGLLAAPPAIEMPSVTYLTADLSSPALFTADAVVFDPDAATTLSSVCEGARREAEFISAGPHWWRKVRNHHQVVRVTAPHTDLRAEHQALAQMGVRIVAAEACAHSNTAMPPQAA